MDVMLDIETLDTRPGAIVLSIGAVRFDPCAGTVERDGFQIALSIAKGQEIGGTIDAETLKWWMQQGEIARQKAFSGEWSPLGAMQKLDGWWHNVDHPTIECVWANDPSFDCVLLEEIARRAKAPIPWNFRQQRSCRTTFALAGYDKPQLKECVSKLWLSSEAPSVAHVALDDAFVQAVQVCEAFKVLGKGLGYFK